MESIESKDLTKELWREYEFSGRTYRIEAPQRLWIGTTRRQGQGDCVLRWKPRDELYPVQF